MKCDWPRMKFISPGFSILTVLSSIGRLQGSDSERERFYCAAAGASTVFAAGTGAAGKRTSGFKRSKASQSSPIKMNTKTIPSGTISPPVSQFGPWKGDTNTCHGTTIHIVVNEHYNNSVY